MGTARLGKADPMRPIKSDILAVEIVPVEGQSTLTVVLSVQRTGAPLGSIRWDGKWRQYAFTPAPDARYASRCLNDINRQLRALMRGWEKDQRRLVT